MVPLANILPNWYSLYTDFGFSFHYNDWYLYYTDNAGIDREVYIIDELNRWEKLWKSPGWLQLMCVVHSSIHLILGVVILVQISCTWITYIFGKFACKCSKEVQIIGFALPLSLINPICISALSPLCIYRWFKCLRSVDNHYFVLDPKTHVPTCLPFLVIYSLNAHPQWRLQHQDGLQMI